MITASHLPYNRNGFKFFTKEGGYEKKDISELLTVAAQEHDAENAPNTAADARYRDEAFVLSSALHSEPGLIEQARLLHACALCTMPLLTCIYAGAVLAMPLQASAQGSGKGGQQRAVCQALRKEWQISFTLLPVTLALR